MQVSQPTVTNCTAPTLKNSLQICNVCKMYKRRISVCVKIQLFKSTHIQIFFTMYVYFFFNSHLIIKELKVNKQKSRFYKKQEMEI